MKLEDTSLVNPINLNYLFQTPVFSSYYCRPLNSENELNLALDRQQKMLQLGYNNQQTSNVIEAAITNALSMNYQNPTVTNYSNIALAAVEAANAINLNKNNLDTLNKSTIPITQLKQSNGSINSSTATSSSSNNNNQNSADGKKIMLKKSNNERKYPCGFPGCHWIFTRSNHVVRHQRRIHGLKIDSKIENTSIVKPSNPPIQRRIISSNAPTNNGVTIIRNQSNQINQQLMVRRMNLKDDYSRLNQLATRRLSKNSLLSNNQICDNLNDNNIANLAMSRQTAFKIPSNQQTQFKHQLKQQQSHLKIGNISGIRRFQCNVDNCGQKFSSEILFNNHLKMLHNVDRSLINKSVNLGNQLNSNNSNINSNHHNSKNSQSLINNNLIVTNPNQINNPKIVKNNLNSINNHFKLFLSNNKTINSKNDNQQQQQNSLTSYINNISNLNANLKLKLLQTAKANQNNNNNINNNNLLNVTNLNQSQQHQIITKVNSIPNQLQNSINSQQPKMYLPVSAINNLNLDQQNKQLLITQIDLTNDKQLNDRSQIKNITQPSITRILYQCEIKNCQKRFNKKDNLVDHLFDDHRVFEPEIIVNLDDTEKSWLSIEDPKKCFDDLESIGQPLPKSSELNNDKNDYRPSKIARTYNEPSLAATLGIVKEVVTKIDNVNTLNNISATSTYSNLNKNHVCNINGCTKSFTKRYHLVRHRLEAHQVGRLSLMEDILLNEKNNQQKQQHDSNNDNINNAIISSDSNGITTIKINNTTVTTSNATSSTATIVNNKPSISLIIKMNDKKEPTSATTNITSNNNNSVTPFYIRRPPQDFRPYPCLVANCGWSFKRSYHLKRHQKLHLNINNQQQKQQQQQQQQLQQKQENLDEEQQAESDVSKHEEQDEEENDNSIESDSNENKTNDIEPLIKNENVVEENIVKDEEIEEIDEKEDKEDDKKEDCDEEEKQENDIKSSDNKVTPTCSKKIITRLSLVKKEVIQDDPLVVENKSEDIEIDDKSTIKPLKTIIRPNNKKIETRKITRQFKQETITDEENSCDVSNSQQTIECEFSSCNKRFTRQRQYDLHIKTHLQDKQKTIVAPQIKRLKSDQPQQNSSLDLSSTNANSINDSSEDNSSEERYTIASCETTNSTNSRSSRTRRGGGFNDLNNNLSLELDNKKIIDSQQLLLLCNTKDMVFLNTDNQTTTTTTNTTKSKKDKSTFICDVNNCGKRYLRNCELTRHKLNHSDFWPYVCEYNCGKKFKRKDVYKNHQRTHIKNGDKID